MLKSAKALKITAVASLVINLINVLWGAFVRASGSGAGCGAHWPNCDGQVIPSTFTDQKAIEFTHRSISGLSFLVVIALAFSVYSQFERKSRIRKATNWALFFICLEALLGAALVLFGWVNQDRSTERTIAMSVHLVNTNLLVASILLVVYWAFGGRPIRYRNQGAIGNALTLGLVGTTLVVVSGALTALGDTLFPIKTAFGGVARSLDPAASFLERLRIAHPILSVSVTAFLILSLAFVARRRSDADVSVWVKRVVGVLVFQLACGVLNIYLKAPIWMQIVHLAISNVVWVGLVITSAVALSDKFQLEPDENESAHAAIEMTPKETVQAYVSLTKPRVISLLLFTTLAAMVIANGGWPNGWMLFWVTIGGYFAAGAANAINMVIDRDIDGLMKRTSQRPTVTSAISSTAAMTFALILATLSFIILSVSANVLSASLALAGLLFYVFIYTLLLKRRTWQNIVIGGAAGAFPPLVGWAAVRGDLSWLAWFLFALIFMWTPVHFWALALFIKDDYAAVGVPMLPIVKGDRATVIQITVYAVLTALLCIIPVLFGALGVLYMIGGLLLNVLLVLLSVQLMNQTDRPHAVRLFKYSMVYLALVFVLIAMDRSIRPMNVETPRAHRGSTYAVLTGEQFSIRR